MTEHKAYSDKLKKAAKLLSENTMHLIGCIVEKHDAAIIEVGLEMQQYIKQLEHQNETMHDALMRIECEPLNAEYIARDTIDFIAKLEGRDTTQVKPIKESVNESN